MIQHIFIIVIISSKGINNNNIISRGISNNDINRKDNMKPIQHQRTEEDQDGKIKLRHE